jgi:hypothetical protein
MSNISSTFPIIILNELLIRLKILEQDTGKPFHCKSCRWGITIHTYLSPLFVFQYKFHGLFNANFPPLIPPPELGQLIGAPDFA